MSVFARASTKLKAPLLSVEAFASPSMSLVAWIVALLSDVIVTCESIVSTFDRSTYAFAFEFPRAIAPPLPLLAEPLTRAPTCVVIETSPAEIEAFSPTVRDTIGATLAVGETLPYVMAPPPDPFADAVIRSSPLTLSTAVSGSPGTSRCMPLLVADKSWRSMLVPEPTLVMFSPVYTNV